MDFTDTPKKPPIAPRRAPGWKRTPPSTPSSAARRWKTTRATSDMARGKAWQAKKAAAGYAQITWPKEWGGAGGTPIAAVIFGQEEARFGVGSGYFAIGLGMCVPTVMAFADDATKTRFVGPALRGEEIWCQLFSEPSGGSDVAAAAHPRRARRRRLDHQRPEGLDLRRPLLRLRHRHRPHQPGRAQAQGPDHVLARHEVAGHRGAADPPDVGRLELQRGLFHRRAGQGQPAAGRGRRRLEGLAGHPDERAAGGRRRHGARLFDDPGAGPRAADRRAAGAGRPGASARSWPTGTCSPRG